MTISLNKTLIAFLSLISLGVTLPATAYEYDPENGAEINEVCAGCHGEYGQGGKDGEYPRLAAMPAEFIAEQLRLFKARKRPNLAMVEYVDERQMPENDILDVANFLSQITLKTKLPPVDDTAPGFDAYARLLESKKLMQIPRVEGDIEKGKKSYKKECATCHGPDGMGIIKKSIPMLAGQYTKYLWRQVKKYREFIRIHDKEEPNEELLADFTDEELQDIFAYLSIMDD